MDITKEQALSKLMKAMSKISGMSKWEWKPDVLMFHGTPEDMIVMADYTRDLGPKRPVFIDIIQNDELTNYPTNIGMSHHEAVAVYMKLVSEYDARNS